MAEDIQRRVTRFSRELKSRNEDVAKRAVVELEHYLVTEMRELSGEQTRLFIDSFIMEMIRSNSDLSEKKAGVLAIVTILRVDVGYFEGSYPKITSFLRDLLPTNDLDLMNLTSKATGMLAMTGGTFSADYVEFESKRAIEWLETTKNDQKRHAAVLILKELAMCTPTLFYPTIAIFFESIFQGIRDSRLSIRLASVGALQSALAVISQRESKNNRKNVWYKFIYDKAMKDEFPVSDPALRERRLSKEDWAHGSLLALDQLLRISNLKWEISMDDMLKLKVEPPIIGQTDGKFGRKQVKTEVRRKDRSVESYTCQLLLKDQYLTVCSHVFSFRNSQSLPVFQCMLNIIPRLAGLNPDDFTTKYLQLAMATLLGAIRKERAGPERGIAFRSMGLLAVAVGRDIKPYHRDIVDVLRAALPPKDLPQRKQRSWAVDPGVFACVGLLARALGNFIIKDLRHLLELMFLVPINPPLISSLKELSLLMPSLRKEVHDGLISRLAQLLIGTGKGSQSTVRLSVTMGEGLPVSGESGHDIPTLTLALKTLSNFNFESQSMNNFVRHTADTWLRYDRREVRTEAISACAHLLVPCLKVIQSAKSDYLAVESAERTLTDVLSKLLLVAITDPVSDVRTWVLTSLDVGLFDSYLAQADSLTCLFTATQDETFDVRVLSTGIVGRLCQLNTGYIMPTLRDSIQRILTSTERSGVGRNMEQSAVLFGRIVANAPLIAKPYIKPAFTVFIPKLEDSKLNSGVISKVLKAVGQMADASGKAVKPYMDRLLPIIMDIMQNSSSLQTKEAVIWTFSRLVSSTGMVVEPYEMYPNLLDLLMNFLRTEPAVGVRKEVIRLLGVLGALDPYYRKAQLGEVAGVKSSDVYHIWNRTKQDEVMEATLTEMLVTMGTPALDDFCPAASIKMLMRIIGRPAHAHHHNKVVQAITFIFKTLGTRSTGFIPEVIPPYLNLIENSEEIREFLFKNLATIVAVVGAHIHLFLDDIVRISANFWAMNLGNDTMQETIIALLDSVVVAVGPMFKIHMHKVLPMMLKVLMKEGKNKKVSLELLRSLKHYEVNLNEFLHLILPLIMGIVGLAEAPTEVKRVALDTITKLTVVLDFSPYASLMLHPIARCVDEVAELRDKSMAAIAAVAEQMGPKFEAFVPVVSRVVEKHRINSPEYNLILPKLIRGGTLAEEEEDPYTFKKRQRVREQRAKLRDEVTFDSAPITMSYVNPANLLKASEAAVRESKEDWIEWLRNLTVQLVRESPANSVKACASLCQSYSPLAKDLFNLAFVSCWAELTAPDQDKLIANISTAMSIQFVPEVTQPILNLAEFMDHADKGRLPLSKTLLVDRAMESRAYAKALHFIEEIFLDQVQNHVNGKPDMAILELLISVNNKLHQYQSSKGVLVYAESKLPEEQIPPHWYEKLRRYRDARRGFERQLAKDQYRRNFNIILGNMRCMEALGDWHALLDSTKANWDHLDAGEMKSMSKMAASAAWALGEWDLMDTYSNQIPATQFEQPFQKAVVNIRKENLPAAHFYIQKSTDLLEMELTALAGEGYERSYSSILNAQMVAELEEVIVYKLVDERQEDIKDMWWKRMKGCEQNPEDLLKLIRVHALVLSPQEDSRSWLKYAGLCRKRGNLELSQRALNSLAGFNMMETELLKAHRMIIEPRVFAGCVKHKWMDGQKEEAFELMKYFVQTTPPMYTNMNLRPRPHDDQDMSKLLSKCYLNLGRWNEELTVSSGSVHFYGRAVHYNKTWYKAWNAYAYSNFTYAMIYKGELLSAEDGQGDATAKESLDRHALEGVKGFLESIKLSPHNALQDTLRLLTLMFDFSEISGVYSFLSHNVPTINIDNWLQVIPQLIARIDTPRRFAMEILHKVLYSVGQAHPQALIYPLMVACKSSDPERKAAADKVLDNMRFHSANLVEEALMLSHELIRVAILWQELWYDGLDEASRMYYNAKSMGGFLQVLAPLHQMTDQEPQTMKEIAFKQQYGKDLAEASEWVKKYKRTGATRDIQQAWDIYYYIFRNISKQLPLMTNLDLQTVSPQLLKARDFEIGVPGLYQPNKEITCIQSVHTHLQVLTSKQRPRRISIFGHDGKEYMFLLKGHEDLRQDERVMQLFGLVNSLMLADMSTARKNLIIQRYSVIPLSNNCGLIGWVPNTDTLHSLIREYRDKKRILLNIEHRVMLKMAPDYDHLPLLRKVEVFEHALANTAGDDLAKILWMKSASSEMWFERRTTYVRSLAVMSMVGYILGLGDRHPSNLMLDRHSGKVIHIDLGDCFEVAMNRDKFPEKIPFRLTRMLTNAMEVAGLDGTFRCTCEDVMEVMRAHKDGVCAVLEAFVYDPLLSWWLQDSKAKADKRLRGSATENNFTAMEGRENGSSIQPPQSGDMSGPGNGLFLGGKGEHREENMNQKALEIIRRVQDKLNGRDFPNHSDVQSQVDALIEKARNNQNLCQCYVGWCPFW